MRGMLIIAIIGIGLINCYLSHENRLLVVQVADVTSVITKQSETIEYQKEVIQKQDKAIKDAEGVMTKQTHTMKYVLSVLDKCMVQYKALEFGYVSRH